MAPLWVTHCSMIHHDSIGQFIKIKLLQFHLKLYNAPSKDVPSWFLLLIKTDQVPEKLMVSYKGRQVGPTQFIHNIWNLN